METGSPLATQYLLCTGKIREWSPNLSRSSHRVGVWSPSLQMQGKSLLNPSACTALLLKVSYFPNILLKQISQFSTRKSHWVNKLFLRVGCPAVDGQQKANSMAFLEVPCLIMSCWGFFSSNLIFEISGISHQW